MTEHLPGIKVTITRARAEELLAALDSGKALTPSGEAGWTGDDMLALAGFCLFGAMSQGPAAWCVASTDPETFEDNLVAAAKVYASLAAHAEDKRFQPNFGAQVYGLAHAGADGPEFRMIRSN
jgi:hypothetical protein